MGEGLKELLFILGPQIQNSISPVESHSNSLISLYELVKLLCEVLILSTEHSDVVVESVNFYLNVGVVVKEGGVAIPCSL